MKYIWGIITAAFFTLSVMLKWKSHQLQDAREENKELNEYVQTRKRLDEFDKVDDVKDAKEYLKGRK